jgi:drug/metabolite transporter (DMT)-like permease
MAKRSIMCIAFYAVLALFSTLLWQHVWFWTPVKLTELPLAFWLCMSGMIFSECLYCWWLSKTYKDMEISSAYPMMRALPLILISIITALTGWGKPLSICAVSGMFVVFAGCMLMPLKNFSDFRLKNYLNRNMLSVLLVACGISGYTLLDSQGQAVMRSVYPDLPKPVISLSYSVCRGTTLTAVLFICVLFSGEERKKLAGYIKTRNWIPALAGIFSSFTYSSVLIAMNYVTNVTYVQVFRQLGLVFGVAGGIILFKERCSATKFVGVSLILAGLFISVL